MLQHPDVSYSHTIIAVPDFKGFKDNPRPLLDLFLSLQELNWVKVHFSANEFPTAFVSRVVYHCLTTGLGRCAEVRARRTVREFDCGVDDPVCLL